MIIDTHLHILDLDTLKYPWLADVAPLNHNHLYADYAPQAEAAGITATLHMEADVAPDLIDAEIRNVEAVARGANGRLTGMIAACRPEDDGFAAWLENIGENSMIRGLRRPLHVVPDAVSHDIKFRANLALLGKAGLSFDLCVLARQLPLAIALVAALPDVTFVLDHCGVPDIAGNDFTPWAAHISDLAKRANVVVKISGIQAYAGVADPDAEILRPWFEHSIAAFGWDRVIWGSDWPVCNLGGDLAGWVAKTRTLLAGCSDDERNALLWKNAVRLWDLPVLE